MSLTPQDQEKILNAPRPNGQQASTWGVPGIAQMDSEISKNIAVLQVLSIINESFL